MIGKTVEFLQSVSEWYISKIRKVDCIRYFVTLYRKNGRGDLENKIILHKKPSELIICSLTGIVNADLIL